MCAWECEWLTFYRDFVMRFNDGWQLHNKAGGGENGVVRETNTVVVTIIVAGRATFSLLLKLNKKSC